LNDGIADTKVWAWRSQPLGLSRIFPIRFSLLIFQQGRHVAPSAEAVCGKVRTVGFRASPSRPLL
jgi:hypothetical protein